MGILVAAGTAQAATYQVGPGRPLATIQDVAKRLAPGDVVELDGGATYPGDLTFTKSGTKDARITIRGVRRGGKRPVIAGGVNTVHVHADHYVLEGLDITGGATRCVFHHGDDLTLRDSVVHDCKGHGILGADEESGSITLSYVEVYGCGDGLTRHQIYIATDEEMHRGSVFRMEHSYVHDGRGGNNVKSRAERNEIYYNWIEGAAYHELELIGPDGADEKLAREDSDVVGNVLRKTRPSWVTRLGGDGTGQTFGRYRFVNNTFILAQGSLAAFRLFDGIESVEMHNNVFYREGGGGAQIVRDKDANWASGSAIAGSNNWVMEGSTDVPRTWTGTITGESPGFRDVAALDFRPAKGSALVDHASASLAGPPGHPFPSPLASPAFLPPPHTLEALGAAVPRPVAGAMDIGAYELGPAGGVSPKGASSVEGDPGGGTGGGSSALTGDSAAGDDGDDGEPGSNGGCSIASSADPRGWQGAIAIFGLFFAAGARRVLRAGRRAIRGAGPA